jgi:hypothetical protein
MKVFPKQQCHLLRRGGYEGIGNQSEASNGNELGPEETEGENHSSKACVVCNSHMSIPYCSFTGVNQPCYKWGNGGWQSAYCTTMMSMHPLNLTPNKKGYRFPGQKINGVHSRSN